jgi:monoamine oxidase
MRVVVVGAGLAGLRAAEVLGAAGSDVVLVEGGHRPGGRVRTVHAPFAGGQYSESGAEWVDDIHERLLAQLDRFGVRLLGSGEQWTAIRRWLHHEGRLLSPQDVRAADPDLDRQFADFERIVESATSGVADASAPHLHPDAAAVDARSLADVADEVGLGELGAIFKRRDAQGEFAAEPWQVSLLFVAQQRAHQRDAARGRDITAYRVEGGFTRVADGMAAALGDVVHYGEHLVGVAQHADGVVVHTDQRSIDADHIVLACSFVPLRRVQFHDALPPVLRAAIHELGYGTVTKTSVQWSARQWPKGYATTAGRAQRVYEPTVDQPGTDGILMSYCGGEGGHEWAQMSEAGRIGLAAEEMRAMHGLTADVVGGYSRAWSTEPRYGGSYCVYLPGQVGRFWQAMREPWGRVHFAGEHVATCTGYMEGALESGETVATRLIAAG